MLESENYDVFISLSSLFPIGFQMPSPFSLINSSEMTLALHPYLRNRGNDTLNTLIIKLRRQMTNLSNIFSIFNIFLLYSFISAQTSRAGGLPQSRRPFRGKACTGLIVDVQYEANRSFSVDETMYLACETQDGKLFKVNSVNRDFIKKQFKEKGFKSGETSLTFDDALINDKSAEITSPVAPRLEKNNKKNERRLAIVEGDVSVLIIRVQAANAATTFSEIQLSDSVFGNNADGNGADPVTLRSQYFACSHGKLRFRPADSRVGRTSRIVNGATTITVDSFTSQGDAIMRNAITQKINEEFGVSSPRALANHGKFNSC